MKLILEINERALPDPNPKLVQLGITTTPPLDGTFWMVRVPVSSKQAVVGFPKFDSLGIGFQVEAKSWNTNLPSGCPALVIYSHIEVNKGPGPRREDCIEAIQMIQRFAMEMKAIEEKPAQTKPEYDVDNVSCRCENCSYQNLHSKLPAAKNIFERLELGGIFTDVECPNCGALCFPVDS